MIKERKDARSCPELHRDVILCSDGGEVSIDWYPSDLPRDAPVLGILHTITGSSISQAGFMQYATNRGWRCCVLNRRGHSGMALRNPCFSVLGNVDDTVAVVSHIRGIYRTNFFALAGISAGSGQVVSYIGREGYSAPIQAAASLCPAWDIRQSFNYLRQRYPFMDRYILDGCKQFFLREPNNQAAFVSMPNAVRSSLQATTLNDFIAAAAPFAGCDSVEDYFKANNPMQFAFGNQTPCLVLNALDDFLCVKENIRYDLIEHVKNYLLVVTEEGSHIAYQEGSDCGNYMWRATLDFFDAVKADYGSIVVANSG